MNMPAALVARRTDDGRALSGPLGSLVACIGGVVTLTEALLWRVTVLKLVATANEERRYLEQAAADVELAAAELPTPSGPAPSSSVASPTSGTSSRSSSRSRRSWSAHPRAWPWLSPPIGVVSTG